MNKIILIGAGGHAKACIDVIEQEKNFKIWFLIDDKKKIKEVMKYKVKRSDYMKRKKITKYAFICIGQIKSPIKRMIIFKELKNKNYKIPVIVSPRAYVSKSSKILEGTIIMHDVVINSSSRIGKNCIINTKAIIEHDAKIEDHCHISTRAVVNGNCLIGKGTFVGSGAIISNNIVIGKNCVIGAGKVIKKNISNNSVIK